MPDRRANHRHSHLLCLLIVLIVLPTLAVPAHAASADLTVDNVWLEKAADPGQAVASVAPGEQFNIVASVKNIGDSAGSGYYLDVYYDSDYGRGGPDNIAAGEVQVWYVGPLTAQSGSHTTKWIVDPDKQIAESNYDNNEKDLTFTIGSETTNTTTTTTSSTTSNSTITSTTQTTTTANSTGTSLGPELLEFGPTEFGPAASSALNAPAGTVYFIFPDGNAAHPKPPGVGYAALSDWTALGFMYGSLANMPQITALDTDSTYVDPATGAPRIHNSIIVLFAGALVNSVVHYYEQNRIAPLWWSLEGDWSTGTMYYRTRSGAVAASMPIPPVSSGSADMGLLEAFTDANGNTVIICSGFGGPGTFVSGSYFKTVLSQYGNLASLTDSWYFYSWTDINGNRFAEYSEVDSTPYNHGN